MNLRHRERSNTCPKWRRAHAGSGVQPTVSTSEVHVARKPKSRCRCVCLSRGRARAAWRRHFECKRNRTEMRTRKKKGTRSPGEMTSCAFLSAAFPSVSMALPNTHNSSNVVFSLCIASPTARPHKKRVHMTNTHPERKDKLTDTYGRFYMPCSNSPSCCAVRMQNHSSQPRTCDHTGQKNRLESAVENGVDPSVRIFKCVALVRFVSSREGEVSRCYSIASAKLKTPLATLCVSSA